MFRWEVRCNLSVTLLKNVVVAVSPCIRDEACVGQGQCTLAITKLRRKWGAGEKAQRPSEHILYHNIIISWF